MIENVAKNSTGAKMAVFVYGTLMEGQANHRLMMEAEKVGQGEIKGFELYDFGGFPGIIAGEGTVKGEIYEIPLHTLLLGLDRLEGYDAVRDTGMYLRRVTEAHMASGEVVEVSYYLWNGRLPYGARKVTRNIRWDTFKKLLARGHSL